MNLPKTICLCVVLAGLAISPAHAITPSGEPPAVSLFERGAEALRTNRIAEARQLFEAALEEEPAFPRALYELGRLEALNGKDASACALLEQALSFAPDFVRAHHALAEVHRRNDRLEEAATSFKRALTLAPQDTESLRGLAFVRLTQGKKGEALYLFERVSEKPATSDPVALEISADAKARAGALKRDGAVVAIPDLTPPAASAASWPTLADAPGIKPVELKPDPATAEALVTEATGHFARREFLKALAALSRARALAPDQAAIAYRLGVTHAALQDFPAAKRAWEEALALGGPRPLITRHLALVTDKLNATRPAASKDLRQAWLRGRLLDALVLASDEDDPLSTHIEADVLMSLGMMAEAVSRYHELLGGDAADRLALAGHAEALKMNGQRELADAARLAFFAPGPDEGWESLFVFRRKELRRLVEAAVAPAP